jgi:hypothetical protein
VRTSKVVAQTVSESQIQRAILDYLAAKHILSFRMQTGSSVRSYGGKTRAIRFGVPGMADILAFPTETIRKSVPVRGGVYEVTLEAQRPTWIECKAPKGKQSDLQKSFQAQVEAEGHSYILAFSLDDLDGL